MSDSLFAAIDRVVDLWEQQDADVWAKGWHSEFCDAVAELQRLRSPRSPAASPVEGERCNEVCCTQRTKCAQCGTLKHTPLRRDELGGYVCLTCIDEAMDSSVDAVEELEQQAARLIERASAAEVKAMREQIELAVERAKALLATPAASPVEGDVDLLSGEVERMQETIDSLRAEIAQLRTWRTPPSPSAKPDTLKKCHALIEYLDVEISGAVQDYLQAKKDRDAAIKNLRGAQADSFELRRTVEADRDRLAQQVSALQAELERYRRTDAERPSD